MIAVVAVLNGIKHILNTVEMTQHGQSNEVVFMSNNNLPGYDYNGNKIPMNVHVTWHSNGVSHLAIYAKEINVDVTKIRYFLEKPGPKPSHFIGESDSYTILHEVDDIRRSPEFCYNQDVIELVHINMDEVEGEFVSVKLTLMEKGSNQNGVLHYSSISPSNEVYLFMNIEPWLRLELGISC